MNEKIRENIEIPTLNTEKEEIIKPLEKKEEAVSLQEKESLLKDIRKKEEFKREGNPREGDIDQEKNVSVLTKEYFSIGADKTIKKARKLGAYFLDMLHDGLTNKNKDKR
jgi:hypothetical protein